MEIMKRLCNGIILIFAIPILSFLLFVNAINTCFVDSASEHTMYVSDNVIVNIGLLGLLLTLVILLRKLHFFHVFSEKINGNERFYLKYRNILLAVIFGISFLWVLLSQLVPAGDQIAIQNQAFLFEIGQYDIFNPGAYLERYWNQLGLMLFSWLLGKTFGFHNYLVFQFLNCIAVTVVFLEFTKLCYLFKWDRMTAIGILTLGTVFLPCILFCSFVYGNWLGLMCGLIAIRSEIEVFREFQLRKAISATLCITFAMLLKSNYIIFFIGMLLFAILNSILLGKSHGFLFVILLGIGYFTQSFLPKAYIQFATGIELAQGEPSYNWIAMGLSEGERGPGWFSGLNYILYERSNYNTAESAEMAKFEIKRSIQTFRTDHNYAASFFERKIASMWSSPTFQAFAFFRNRDSIQEQSSFAHQFLSINSEIICTAFMNSLCFLIYAGALFYILLFSRAEGAVEQLVLLTIFIGGFLFHLVWEVKAVYALSYVILLIPYAIEGYCLVGIKTEYFIKQIQSKEKWHRGYKEYRLNIAVLSVACIGILIIGLKYGFHWLQTDNEMFEKYIQDETSTTPFTGEYMLLSKTGGYLVTTDNDELILSCDQGTIFSLRGYNKGQFICTESNKYLTPVKLTNGLGPGFTLILSNEARPFYKWKIQFMDSEFFRIRYDNLALAVDENSGELLLCQARKNKDDQLWRVIKVD